MLSQTLAKLLQDSKIAGLKPSEIQPIVNGQVDSPQPSNSPQDVLKTPSDSPQLAITSTDSGQFPQKDTDILDLPVAEYLKTYAKNIEFVPLLNFPERICKIEDENTLRQYIALTVSKLTDEQLKEKITIYQKLGVLVRVCESEIHKVGIGRNKKFLEGNEEKSYLKLREPSAVSQKEKKEKKTSDSLTPKQKLVNKLVNKGKSKDLAVKTANTIFAIEDKKERSFVEKMIFLGISPSKASEMFRSKD